MRKVIASTTVAASLLGAGFGAVALGPALAGAQDTETDIDADTETESETETESTRTTLADVLDDLVADGTLTQEQRDIVEERISEAKLGRGHGHRGHGRFGRGLTSEVLEELGLDAEMIRDGLADGQTLGEIAEANGSSVEALTDALTAQAEERIADALESGRIDEDKAAELEAAIDERVEAMVNGEVDFGRRGGFKGRFGSDSDTDSEDLGT